MIKKNRNLIKNIGLFTIGSFGSKILSFLLVPLYTAVLSTEEYGSVDLITSTVSLLMPILLLSIFDATLRFGMDSEYKKEDVLSTSLSIATKGSIILVVGVILVHFTHLFHIPVLYLVFLCIYFILGAQSQIFNLYLRAKNQASIIAISGIICTFITCISNILLLLYFKWGIIGYIVSNTVGVLIQNLYQLILGEIYKDIRIKKYNDLSKPMIKYSTPLIANSISWWINNASDRYILTFLRGVAENGIYSVAYKIPTILTMFQGIVYNAWSISAISEFDENDSDGFIGNNYTIFCLISLIVCSALLIANKPLAMFLYKNDYFIAWKCVPLLLMGTVFSGISQFEGSLYAAARKTKTVAQTTVLGAVVNTIFNFILIYFVGAIGAAMATFLGYLTTWLLRTIYLQSFIKMKVEWEIHFISIFLVSIQSLLATFGISIVIQSMLLVILIVINKKIFLSFVSKIYLKVR